MMKIRYTVAWTNLLGVRLMCRLWRRRKFAERHLETMRAANRVWLDTIGHDARPRIRRVTVGATTRSR